MTRARFGLVLAALCGAGLAAYLVVDTGAQAVLAALRAAGWATLAAVSLAHLAPMLLRGVGWRMLFGPEAHVGWIGFIWARWVREAVDNILPILPVSGVLAGMRVLSARGETRAGASAVVDLTAELLGQAAFGLLGLALLLAIMPDDPRVLWAALGLAIITIAVLGFLAAQLGGLFRFLGRAIDWAWRRREADARQETHGSRADVFHDHIQGFYRHRGRFTGSVMAHFLGWTASAMEVWLALWLMGSGLAVTQALAIESLIFALRSASFFVPWSAGIQESGYVVIGAIFGLSPEIALAVSLLKRGRDLVLGIPVVLAWQVGEGHGMLKRWAGQTLVDLDNDRN
ncbi:MAG TPA: lysylphosphatidylglycerol synthase domain-containing protein [Stellaceae bacterium]|nr:lysylphosphatidylglycerol synthase domain-containing protein [Stellaceae bacterium]